MNRPAQRRTPLGILIGTDDGLLQCIPGAHTEHAIKDARITSIDVRDDLAVAGAPGAAGGVWLHAGTRWQQVWQGDACSVQLGRGGTIFLGTGDGQLLRSVDEGTTWTETRGLVGLRFDGAAMPPRAVPPAITGVVEVTAGLMIAFAGGGVWFTADDGGSWFRRDEGLDAHVHRIYRHPDLDGRLYATARTGLYRTTDQGSIWVPSVTDLDRGWGGSLALLPGARDTLVLSLARSAPGANASDGGALFHSTDGGLDWSRLLLDSEDEWTRAPVVLQPRELEDVVFVAAGSRLFASHDRGASWLALADGLPLANALAASV